MPDGQFETLNGIGWNTTERLGLWWDEAPKEKKWVDGPGGAQRDGINSLSS